MDYPNLLCEIENRVAVVTVSRPRKLNALDRETFVSLERCFADLAQNDDAGAVVLTGAGEKAFVAGADITNLVGLGGFSGKEWCELGQRVFSEIENMRKPVIAAINGFAFGGGLELAMACHLRIAAETARLGQPEVKIGWIPGNGGSQRLPRLVGKGRALEMMLTGDPVTARDALSIGLVNRVVPGDTLLDAARELASKILENSPVAIGACIEAVNRGLEMSFEDGLALEAALSGLVSASEDCQEGTRAFLEKRKPEFRGR